MTTERFDMEKAVLERFRGFLDRLEHSGIADEVLEVLAEIVSRELADARGERDSFMKSYTEAVEHHKVQNAELSALRTAQAGLTEGVRRVRAEIDSLKYDSVRADTLDKVRAILAQHLPAPDHIANVRKMVAPARPGSDGDGEK